MKSLHPINSYLRQAVNVFKALDFTVLDSPEITTEKHNFDDLLIPHDHPARDMQDTFWLENGKLPRTHTSAFQIPAMKNKKPPVRFLIPGRVFRNEATDATHETVFDQLQGFAIDKSINLAQLKGTLTDFCVQCTAQMFKLNLCPHFFLLWSPD